METIVENTNHIVMTELKSEINRLKLVSDNSENDVEVFLAIQAQNVLNQMVSDMESMLSRPEVLEQSAKDYVSAIRNQHPGLPTD